MSEQLPFVHRRTRLLFGLAAAIALVVTGIFAFVGDGVDVPAATGSRRGIVDLEHTAVWALLTAAFGAAAADGRWSRTANGLAMGAGVGYAAFLIAVFWWP